MKSISLVLAVAAAAALAGCATTRLVDSDVQTFSTLPAVAPGATYRFERLPSQQAPTAALQQDQLEQIAQQALERVGLKRDEKNASFGVEVSLDAQRQVSYDPFARPYPYGGWGGYRRYGYGYYGGFGWPGPFPERILYQQQAHVRVRDLASGKVVYETHASHDDLRPADAAVVAVMFDSALFGFPKASLGIRRVNVEIPKPQ
ncbi:MAG: DUF4136 domain-containing protein [Pseudomonadota bacterium]